MHRCKAVCRVMAYLVYFEPVCHSVGPLSSQKNFYGTTFEFPGRIHDGLSSLGFAESDGS